MLNIITINLITGIILIILGNKLGERGGKIIIKRINIINIILLIYYIKRIIIDNEQRRIEIWEWIGEIKGTIIIDKITIIMTLLIIIIGYIVIRYSHWYINELRFKGYLYIFQITMIILVSSRELINIYIGWEWVGIMSYILISYWYNNINNIKSGIKAILYNKIGDIAFILSIIHIYNNNNILYDNSILIPLYIIISSMAKSAQYIMHPWLGDAMAGPTPVSALLHAATMVTAGIVLLYRTININNNIWEYGIYVGIITIIFGGLVSITQNDIKKIIAYSTCSQLGYMYFSIIYNNIDLSLYHLFTHAFFKALLFLTAGIIIHNYNNEQDIRNLGINIKSNQLSYHLLLFSSLSLFAFPYTSGYYSKESIIYSINNKEYYILTIIGAILTVLYSLKLLSKLFFLSHPNQLSLSVQQFPIDIYRLLVILLFGSIPLGYLTYNYFISSNEKYIQIDSTILILTIITIIGYIYIYSRIKINNYYINIILLSIYNFFNKRTYIDSIFNNISEQVLIYSFILYKNLDKGFLEYFGPIGIYRLLLTPRIIAINNISIYYIIYIIIIIIISFIILMTIYIL